MSRRAPDAVQRILRHPAGWIATGFGSGLAPYAPGTVGSLAALLPWLVLRELALPVYLLVLVVALVLGVWACAWTVRRLGVEDPGLVVWDEFVGMWIALLALPDRWYFVVAGFVFFRFFDILKPWPVCWADRNIKGGLGTMLDDVFAGIYALICVQLLAGWLGN